MYAKEMKNMSKTTMPKTTMPKTTMSSTLSPAAKPFQPKKDKFDEIEKSMGMKFPHSHIGGLIPPGYRPSEDGKRLVPDVKPEVPSTPPPVKVSRCSRIRFSSLTE